MKSFTTAFAMGLFTVVLGVAAMGCSSSSSGGSSGSGSGSGCSGLSSCCSDLPSADQSGCQTLASSNNETECDEAIETFHESNYCTNVSAGSSSSSSSSSSSTSGGSNCSTLKSCCTGTTFTGSAAELQPGCMSVYANGTDSECATYLTDLKALGACN